MITTLSERIRLEDRAKAKRYDFGGTIEFKSAEMLGDMPDPKAVPALVKAFSAWEEMPKSVAGHPTREPHFQRLDSKVILTRNGFGYHR